MSLAADEPTSKRLPRTPIPASPGWKTLWARFVAAFALAIGLGALSSCGNAKGEADADGKARAGSEATILVRLGKLERGLISEKLSVSADLQAIRKADVPPEASGIVREVLHREGDLVKKGDPVIQLVNEPLRLAVEQKHIAQAQAKHKIVQADIARREGKELARTKELFLEKAQREYDRMKKLGEDPTQGLVSYEETETKRYAFEQASVDHRTAVLQGERYELEHSQAIDAERLAQVELKTAEYNLALTTIRSPIDGYISYLLTKPGEILATAAKAFTVVDTSRLEARLHVPQKELSRVRVGLPVRIVCEVFVGKEFEGEVEVVNPVVDVEKAAGTVEVIVGLKDKDNFLKPGMFVNGDIILDVHENSVLVSKKAVSYENQEPIIFLVKEQVARRFALRTGYTTKTHIEVLGLVAVDGKTASPEEAASGELGVLVEIGHSNLKEGSRVETDRAR